MIFKRWRLLPFVALLFFVVGAIAIGYGFTQVENGEHWFRLGAFCWNLAYFSVVIDNFTQKAPVQTRGGEVRYEDGRFKYAVPYIPMFLFGFLFLVVVVSA
jgi:hypothetical protein